MWANATVWPTEPPPVPFLPPAPWRPIFTVSPPWEGRRPEVQIPEVPQDTVSQVAREVSNWLTVPGVTFLRPEPDEQRAPGIKDRIERVTRVVEHFHKTWKDTPDPTVHPMWSVAVEVVTRALLVDAPGGGGLGEEEGPPGEGQGQGEGKAKGDSGDGGSEAGEEASASGSAEAGTVEGEEGEQKEDEGSKEALSAPDTSQIDPQREAISKVLPSQRNYGTRAGDPRVSEALLKQLADRFNGPLKRFMDLIGRISASAWAPPTRVPSPAREDVRGVEQGQDMGRLLGSEIVRFLDERLLPGALLDWSERRLLQIEMVGDEPRGRGPILIALDVSPSMEMGDGLMPGVNSILLAQMLCVALVRIGDVQNRPVHLIGFADALCFEHAAKTAADRVKLMLFLSGSIPKGNGTEFDPPLDRLNRVAKDYLGGDVLFITDGEADLSMSIVDQTNRLRKRTGLRVFTLLIDRTVSPLELVSDVVIPLKSVKDLEVLGEQIARKPQNPVKSTGKS